jgi:hemolysin activation/secretion protein
MKKKLVLALGLGVFMSYVSNLEAETFEQLPVPTITTPAPLAPSKSNTLETQKFKSVELKAVEIKTVKIEGNKMFSEATLQKVIKGHTTGLMTIQAMKALANKITAFYVNAGYSLDRAYIPIQTFKNHILVIKVVEVIYSKVAIHNKGHISNKFISSVVGVKDGSEADIAGLNSNLFELSDLPGASTEHATLSPGSIPGSTQLDVFLNQEPQFNASASVNNYGVSYLGAFQLQGTASVNNLFHHGDLLSVQATSSLGGFNFADVSFSTPITSSIKTGVGYTALNYRMGYGFQPFPFMNSTNFAAYTALGSSGYGQTATGWVSDQLIRTENTSVVSTLSYSHDVYSDTYTQGVGNDRSLNVFSASLSGFQRDSFFGGATNSFNVAYSPYILSSASAYSVNPLQASTSGFRSVWTGQVSRVQNLPHQINENNFLTLSGSGQFSTGALDPMQQYVVGGPSSVRAYSEAALFGNEGYTVSAQLTHKVVHNAPLGWFDIPGTWQSSLFFDAGGVSSNTAMLFVAGPGLSEEWDIKKFVVTGSVATPVGGVPGLLGTTPSVQLWLSAGVHL